MKVRGLPEMLSQLEKRKSVLPDRCVAEQYYWDMLALANCALFCLL